MTDDSEIENISDHHGDADTNQFNSTGNNLDVTMETNEHDGVLQGEEDDALFNSQIGDVSQHRITKREASSKYPKKPKESKGGKVISETTGKLRWHQKEPNVEDAQIKFFYNIGEELCE